MNEIRKKVTQLIALNPSDDKTFEGFEERMAKQKILMDELDSLAKEKKTHIGRIIRRPFADSYAYYVVSDVKEERNEIQVRWINYCDGWQDDYFGSGGHFQLDRIKSMIMTKDEIASMYINK